MTHIDVMLGKFLGKIARIKVSRPVCVMVAGLVAGGLVSGAAGFGISGLGVAPAVAKEVFTPAQREAIIEIMRQALKDDPGILSDAVHSLREKAILEQQAKNKAGIQSHWAELTTAPAYAVRGNPQGKTVVVEFLDPRCGYCRRMMPVVDDFLKRHPEVRLVEKIIPVLGHASVTASRAIFAAALQGHYDSMRQAMMTDTAPPDEKRLKALAGAQGLDKEKFLKDMDSPVVTALIAANLGQAQSVGLDGTPTFLFGSSIELPGALSAEQMDESLKKEEQIGQGAQ